MKIAENCVVSIHYTLTNDAGDVIDSTKGKEPLVYLHATGSLIPGLEDVLSGQEPGFSAKVSLEPADAYGEYSDDLIQSLPPEAFEGVERLEAGMQFQAETTEGHMQLITIKEVKNSKVVVDANHPLAGEKLHFDVSVENVREASPEEIEHGHAH